MSSATYNACFPSFGWVASVHAGTTMQLLAKFVYTVEDLKRRP